MLFFAKKIQIIFAAIFISFITIMFVKQSNRRNQLYELSIYGKVISAQKSSKGYFEVELIQNNKSQYIYLKYSNSKLIFASEDSIVKNTKSNIFYIKKSNAANFSLIELTDAKISRKWTD